MESFKVEKVFSMEVSFKDLVVYPKMVLKAKPVRVKGTVEFIAYINTLDDEAFITPVK